MQNVEWENVEFYLPLNFVYEAGDNNPGIHVADILTEREYVQGGGARLIGPLTQIPGVTIERIIPPAVQRQAAQLHFDPRAIVYHATPQAQLAVHEHLRIAGLVKTENVIRVLRNPPPNRRKSEK